MNADPSPSSAGGDPTVAHHQADTDRDPYATVASDSASTVPTVGELHTGGVPGYQVLSEIGRGGMGVVYRARQVQADRTVALKMILSGEYAGSAEVARFRAEAAAVARLQHSHIVAVYDVGEQAGRPFFSMEYCPGGTLAGKAACGPWAVEDAAATVLKLARAVAVAHAAGIVHRDLKPANVLLSADGEPKVSDFGLAKWLSTEASSAGPTQSGAVLGTPSYMAPEQAFGDSKHVGPPADVYALGAILYELLTGRPPFRGATPMDTIVQVVSEDPLPPRKLRADIPRDLEAVCLKCLEKSPHRRYETAGELAVDLTRFINGEPVSIGQAGLAGRMAGAMDRVQLKSQFAIYGTMFLALVPVMLLPEFWVTAVTWNDWPGFLLPAGQWGRLLAFLLVVGYFRNWHFAPSNIAERQLMAIWGGYLLACFALGFSGRVSFGVAAALELHFYQPLSCLTALAFFALAPNFWGYCALIAAGFLLLPFVMAIDLRFAPILFGLAWSATLLIIGTRLRRLAQ